MSNVTKGSITSSFPDSIPSFTAQSEALDPASEDNTLAEGRDANKWSAEIQAIAEAIGVGGRAGVSVYGTTATVEVLEYVYQGTPKSYAGTISLALTTGSLNYIYLDMADNTAKASIVSWPSTPHIRLAIWDDSGTGTATLSDERPHDLKPAAETPAYASTAGWHIDAGAATITNGNTSQAITFNLEFKSAPVVSLTARRPSDATLRKVASSNLTTNGVTAHIDVAAPADGVVVHWIAIGEKSDGVSGSGS